MKTGILALLVLLVVSQGEGIICNCGGLRRCSSSDERCSEKDDVCGRVSLVSGGSTPNFFTGCMKIRDCVLMARQGVATARCCRTDRCN